MIEPEVKQVEGELSDEDQYNEEQDHKSIAESIEKMFSQGKEPMSEQHQSTLKSLFVPTAPEIHQEAELSETFVYGEYTEGQIDPKQGQSSADDQVMQGL